MTAEAFADLMQAQRIGAGRWKARCPAHNDRSPSLSIREGDDGRVLVICRAGCSLDSILAALKLARRDLFAGPPPTPQQAAALRAAQEAHRQAARAERKARLAALDRVERLKAVVSALGAKLARLPNDDARGLELTRLFYAACDRLHATEVEADKFYPMRRVSAQDKDATSGQASV
jgi:hypothetical protein